MYKFVNRNDDSTVYSAVAEVLTKRNSEWLCVQKDSARFHLMLGEINKLPFARLGHGQGMNPLVNYYRGSGRLCRKTALVKTLQEYCSNCNKDPFQIIPPTYYLYPKIADVPMESGNSLKAVKMRSMQNKTDEREAFMKCYHKMKENKQGDVWIAKSTSGAKGEGILISDNPQQLIDYIDEQKQSHVIQKYLEKPLLLNGDRKFDIRCWVLLDHQYNIYLYKEGVLRTASDPYKPQDYSDTTGHLTNHCLQEALSPNFGKYEIGNEMFFDEFNSYLQDRYQTEMEESLIPQIKEIIKESLYSVQVHISTEGLSYHSFQLFGFDFMVDSDFKVWLIEVNGSPASAEKLLPGLSSAIVTVAIDPVFPPQNESEDKEQTLFQKLN
ncbi:tubulin--tyrosine ligase-like [Saccoglossus kowalevskii]|uniref:Tubulin--tyrosine ligase n=1 Tax=Saccoglossus kowalevskii TaxID=10224 RepID=A0ABM0MZ30_SACKO|nr:PREDICTED: tubulin--tyrosine ligase-like [Saccoglossus kowalevskii]